MQTSSQTEVLQEAKDPTAPTLNRETARDIVRPPESRHRTSLKGLRKGLQLIGSSLIIGGLIFALTKTDLVPSIPSVSGVSAPKLPELPDLRPSSVVLAATLATGGPNAARALGMTLRSCTGDNATWLGRLGFFGAPDVAGTMALSEVRKLTQEQKTVFTAAVTEAERSGRARALIVCHLDLAAINMWDATERNRKAIKLASAAR